MSCVCCIERTFVAVTGVIKYLHILQTERAFQKQRGVFLNSKVGLTGKKKKKEQRFVRNVGLGFKTPREVRLCDQLISMNKLSLLVYGMSDWLIAPLFVLVFMVGNRGLV